MCVLVWTQSALRASRSAIPCMIAYHTRRQHGSVLVAMRTTGRTPADTCVCVCVCVSIGLTEHTDRGLARVGLTNQVCMCVCVCVSLFAAPCAHVKPSAKCVALADGSACVVRRQIPADNSCLFNAVAYCMHGSKQKAAFLRYAGMQLSSGAWR